MAAGGGRRMRFFLRESFDIVGGLAPEWPWVLWSGCFRDRAGGLVRIKFWGTRGSIARGMTEAEFARRFGHMIAEAEAAGITTLRGFAEAIDAGRFGRPLAYGGNTTCMEIAHGGDMLFVDMGTGLREAGAAAMLSGRTEYHFLLTHAHWDHVMGLPFFVPVFMKGNKLVFHHVHETMPDDIRVCFNGVNFPVPWSVLGSEREFVRHETHTPFAVGGMTVTPFVLDHPGRSFGYRVEAGGKSIVIAGDSEYKRVTPEALGADRACYQHADVLVFDAQYDLDELVRRFDFGHSSPIVGVGVAMREHVRKLVLTHHDPYASDDKIHQSLRMATDHRDSLMAAAAEAGRPVTTTLDVVAAWDGMEIDLEERS